MATGSASQSRPNTAIWAQWEAFLTEFVAQGVVNMDARPIRAGYLVRPGDGAAFKHAVLLACDRWGGQQEPILPISRTGKLKKFWNEVREAARPDVYVDLAGLGTTNSQEVGQRFASQVWPADQFKERYDRLHPLGAHSPAEVRDLRVVMPKTRTVGSLAAAGAIPDDAEIAEWRHFGAAVQISNDNEELAIAQLTADTVLAASVHQCGEVLSKGWGGGVGTVWIADPGSLRDALLFWNYRARMTLRVVPAFAVLTTLEAARSLVLRDEIAEQVHTQPFDVRPAFVLSSLSVPRDDLRELIRQWGFSEHTDARIERSFRPGVRNDQPITVALNWQPLHPDMTIDGARQPVLTQLYRPTTKILAPIPITFHPRIGGTIRVRISGPAALNFPPSAQAVRLAHPNAFPSQVGFELTTNVQQLYEWDINVPQREEVLRALLQERGVSYKINAKGHHSLGVLHLAPDPQLFNSARVEAVVSALTSARSAHIASELTSRLKDVSEERRRDLAALFAEDESRTFLSLEQITIKAKLTSGETLATLTKLMEQRLAERGLAIRCPECGIRSFVPLQRAVEPAQCPACTSRAAFQAPDGSEPTVFYRLNSLLETSSAQGVIVHLFGTSGLLRRDPDAFVLQAADLSRGNAGIGEADLVCLSGSDVYLGEAKRTKAWFTRSQIQKDLRLAEQLRATTYVMICIEPIDQWLQEMALKLALRKGISLMIIDGPEANPRDVQPPAKERTGTPLTSP